MGGPEGASSNDLQVLPSSVLSNDLSNDGRIIRRMSMKQFISIKYSRKYFTKGPSNNPLIDTFNHPSNNLSKYTSNDPSDCGIKYS